MEAPWVNTDLYQLHSWSKFVKVDWAWEESLDMARITSTEPITLLVPICHSPHNSLGLVIWAHGHLETGACCCCHCQRVSSSVLHFVTARNCWAPLEYLFWQCPAPEGLSHQWVLRRAFWGIVYIYRTNKLEFILACDGMQDCCFTNWSLYATQISNVIFHFCFFVYTF